MSYRNLLVPLLIAVSLTVACAQPPVPMALDTQILQMMQSGQYAEALQECIKRVKADPHDVEAVTALDMAFDYCHMTSHDGDAEAAFRAWTAAVPDSALASAWLGAVLTTMPNRRDEAEKVLLQALTLDPQCPDVRFRLAALQELQGKEDEAQAGWRKFLELEPDTDRAWLVKHRLVAVACTALTKSEETLIQDMPTWSPDGKQIAYRKGWEGLVAISRVESGEERKIGNLPVPKVINLNWSPDGKSIVSSATADWKVMQLYIVDPLAVSPPRLLVDHPMAYYATWSPDGTKVMFDGKIGKNWGGGIVNADGTGLARVPGAKAVGMVMDLSSFAPDGTRVCSVARVGKAGSFEVFVWNYNDGKQLLQLTENDAYEQYPIMRPDGETVLFTSDFGGTLRNLRAVAVDEPKREAQVLRLFYLAKYGPIWSWSPDGRKLVGERPFGGKLWVVTLGGLNSLPVKLTTKPQTGGLTVTVTNRRDAAVTVDIAYRLFDANSVQVAEGSVGKHDMSLQKGEVIECPLPLDAAKQPGAYTVKLTAVTDKGERVVELVDCEVKQ